MSAPVVRYAALVTAVAAIAMAPASASASSAFRSAGSDTLNYNAGLGEANQVAITHAGGVFTIADPGATISPGTSCSPTGDVHVVTCAESGVARLDVELLDLGDSATIVAALPARLRGNEGSDMLTGGEGGDTIDGGSEQDTLNGGPGFDVLSGEENVNVCNGASGNTLDGGPGDDLLRGGEGPDSLRGGDGKDTIQGCAGDDGLSGDAGDDLLVSGDGNDTLGGGSGDDQLGSSDLLGFPGRSQELGDDSLDGGPGDDQLFPGHGPGSMVTDADTLVGGGGLDRVSYAQRTESVRVLKDAPGGDGQAGENDAVAADVDVIVGGAGGDVLVGGNGNDTIDGGPGDDQIAGLAGLDSLIGGRNDGGADTIDGGDDADQLEGDGGEDTLTGAAGADVASGGGGDDELRGGTGDDTLRGEADDDHFEGGGGGDRLRGGDGTDEAEYPSGRAVRVTLDGDDDDGREGEHDNVARDVEDVLGGRQEDTFIGAARVANRLVGGSGQDYVDGGAGAGDRLTGGTANDVVRGRDGRRDTVRCGPGKSDFAIVDRRDRVRTAGREACERIDDGTRTSPRLGDVRVDPDRCPRGEFNMQLPAMKREVPLADDVLVPLRTELASEDCGVLLQTAVGGGATTRLRAPGSRIHVRTPGALTRVVLHPPGCDADAAGEVETARHRDPPATLIAAKLRRRKRPRSAALVGELLVVAGRVVASAAGDAKWRTVMDCESTRVRVTRGVVTVVDRRGGRRARLRDGESFKTGPA